MDALKKSMQTADQDQKEARIKSIQEPLKPLSERDNQCGAAYYATEDLTLLAGLPEMAHLLAQFNVKMEQKREQLLSPY